MVSSCVESGGVAGGWGWLASINWINCNLGLIYLYLGVDFTPFWSDGYRLRGLADVTDDVGLFLSTGKCHFTIQCYCSYDIRFLL